MGTKNVTLYAVWKVANNPSVSKLANRISKSNYGQKVEYSAGGVSDWKIFYNDGTNVFIIASDYLNNSLIPSEAGIKTSGTYGAYWSAGSFTKKGCADITSTPTTTYLACGNPSSLYYPHSDIVNKCEGYWIASPSAQSKDNLITAWYYSYINNQGYANTAVGLRPVVMLKSDTAGIYKDNKWKLGDATTSTLATSNLIYKITWQNSKATVTFESTTSHDIQTSTDGSTWTTGNSITVLSGTQIYVRYKAGNSTSMSYAAVKPVKTCKIYFSANGGTGAPSAITRTYGQAVTFPTNVPTKTGYTFKGWLYYGKGDSSSTATSTATSATYKAGETAQPKTGNICYDANNTTYVAIYEAKTITLTIDPGEAGYIYSADTGNDWSKNTVTRTIKYDQKFEFADTQYVATNGYVCFTRSLNQAVPFKPYGQATATQKRNAAYMPNGDDLWTFAGWEVVGTGSVTGATLTDLVNNNINNGSQGFRWSFKQGNGQTYNSTVTVRAKWVKNWVTWCPSTVSGTISLEPTADGNISPTVFNGEMINLEAGRTYALTLKYKCTSGENTFQVDFYAPNASDPDILPEISLVATTSLQEYVWYFTVNEDTAWDNCQLRFFDNTTESGAGTVQITTAWLSAL